SPPALVLVGEKAPPTGGVDYIKALRKEKNFATVPIIFLAAHKNSKGASAARDAGASDHLFKPYLRSSLINIISSKLNAKVENDWEALPPVPKKALKATVDAFNKIADVIS